MTTDFEELVRDSMEQFAAGVRLPAGLAGRARRRHRRRRFAQCTAIVAGTAVVVAATVTGAGAVARTARPSAAGGSRTGHLHALTTAYVVQRVSDALTNDNLVLRATRSASADGRPTYCCSTPGGQLSTQYVVWIYQGHISYYLYGVHSPQWNAGTALVDGKLTEVYVDYQAHNWRRIPGNLLQTPPGSACTRSNFLPATQLDANWPSEIRSSLACGAYQADGYAGIGGLKTIKVTGSVGLNDGRIAVTLFVDPTSFLPVQITTSMSLGGPYGFHSVQSTADLQWLKPTPANTAQTLVTIPAGYPETSGD